MSKFPRFFRHKKTERISQSQILNNQLWLGNFSRNSREERILLQRSNNENETDRNLYPIYQSLQEIILLNSTYHFEYSSSKYIILEFRYFIHEEVEVQQENV